MIDEKFGKLRVLNRHGYNNRGEITWECLCDCGNKKVVKGPNLKSGKTKSCGCIKTGPAVKDESGQIFNNFTLLEFVSMDKNRISLWLARCICGNEKIIRTNNKRLKSCGCVKKKVDKDRKGKNHPCWNPSITDEERNNLRITEDYKDWKYKVKEKYKFTCLVCGDNKGGNLVSHHLFSYKDNPKLRTDIKNGVCLCDVCHKNFHKIYGYGKNSIYQFYEYINNFCIFEKKSNNYEQLESFKRENIDIYPSIR